MAVLLVDLHPAAVVVLTYRFTDIDTTRTTGTQTRGRPRGFDMQNTATATIASTAREATGRESECDVVARVVRRPGPTAKVLLLRHGRPVSRLPAHS
jgi:hypothetical protein